MRTPVSLLALLTAALLASCGTPAPAPGDTGGTPPGNPGQPNPQPQPQPQPGPSTGDAPPAALAGEWHFGYISPIEYYDPSTGKYMEASGTSAILHLNADGTFSEVGINVVTVGVCTTRLLVKSEGIVKYADQTLTRIDRKVNASVYDSCTKKETTGGTLTEHTDRWSVEGEGDQAVLTFTDAKGGTGRWNRPRGTGGTPNTGGYSISGTLTAPSGHKLYDTTVLACPKATGCANAGDRFKFFKVGSELNTTTWEIKGLTNEEYLVYAWQDIDKDRAYSVGDWFDQGFLSGEGTFVNPSSGREVHFVMEQATE